MADNVLHDLIVERFRENRTLHERTAERLDRIERRLSTLEGHVGTLVKSEFARDDEFSLLEARIARIERRLELNDGNA